MNKLRGAYNLQVARNQPFSLIHFVTNRCNARCTHCFIDFDHPDAFKGELTLEEIEKLSKTFGNSLFNINITGGEPFLRKDLFEIVKIYFENTTIESVYITTNGFFTPLVKLFIEKIIALKTKKKVIFSISIDNFVEDHDKNRKVQGLYKHALETYHMIRSFNNENIIVNIGITVTHHNYEKVLDLYAHLKEVGIRSITATLYREEGIIKKIDPDLKKRILDQYALLTEKIYTEQRDGIMEGFGGSMEGRLLNSKNKIMSNIIKETYIDGGFISPCRAAALFGVIYANGDVYPCEILPKPLGNLRDFNMNFMDLWNTKKVSDMRKWIVDTKCNCTFECAWAINIIANKRFLPTLAYNAVTLPWSKKKSA